MKTKKNKTDIELIVDGLNVLSGLVQKMVQSIERMEGTHAQFKVLDTRGCTKEFLVERVLQGVWLLSAKQDMKHGEFQAFRMARGLSPRTGVYMMNVAARFLCEIPSSIPSMFRIKAWENRSDIREAAASFVGDKSWRQLISLK